MIAYRIAWGIDKDVDEYLAAIPIERFAEDIAAYQLINQDDQRPPPRRIPKGL